MGSTFEVKNTGELKLKSFSSDPTGSEGMLIYNSTDKKIKIHDGTSWNEVGGAGGLPWFLDDTKYSVFDDFTTLDTTTKWNVGGITALNTASLSATNNAGGVSPELKLDAYSDGGGTSDIYIDTKSNQLPTNATGFWGRLYWNLATSGSSCYLRINGSNIATLASGTTSGEAGFLAYTISDIWYVTIFLGNKTRTTYTNLNSLGFQLQTTGSTHSQLYVDDIRYI